MPDTDSARRGWSIEGLRWAIVTLLIPFAGFVWNEVQKAEVERQKDLERVRADEQARVANARSESDIVIKLMPALASDDGSPMRGIALAVLLNLADRKALSPELASSVQVAVVTTQQRVRDGKATEAERVALGKIAGASDRPSSGASGDAAAEPSPPPPPSTAQSFQVQVPRVYIHIFDEADRKSAQDLVAWCTKNKPWLVPGVENVVATATRANRKVPKGLPTTRVLYFNDEDRSRAEEIATHLRQEPGTPAVAVEPRHLDAPPGQLEVWFPGRASSGVKE